LIYALGGGLGHLQRSLSLAKAAAARGHTATILTNSPAYPRIADRCDLAGVTILEMPRGDALAPAVHRLLDGREHDAVVVDTLPRGVLGELAAVAWQVPAVFVHRDITSAYAHQVDVQGSTQRFDLMLCPGERGPLDHHNLVETKPWVLMGPEELLPRSAARAALGCPDDRPLVVVCDTTEPRESAGLAYLVEHLREAYGDAAHVMRASLEATWPLMRLHLGVDLLIGAAGYNTVHEARLTATPLKALARERLYDLQDRRLLSHEVLDDAALPGLATRTSTVDYDNGSSEAVRCIEEVSLQ
jgi:hypothetical protein